jgi:hypothetical protein
MARDTAAAAGNNAKTGQALATNYGDRASSGYNVLTPTLNKLATAPQGFDPQTMANMTTAAKQSIGGATAATVGGGLQRGIMLGRLDRQQRRWPMMLRRSCLTQPWASRTAMPCCRRSRGAKGCRDFKGFTART